MLATLATAWSLLVVALSGVALAYRLRLRPRAPLTRPYTVLRPCEGADPGLEEALASSFRAPGVRQVLVCTPGPEDPASAVARRVIAAFPDVDGRLVHDAEPGWKNPKARRLSGAWPLVGEERVILADADVHLDAAHVGQLLAGLDGAAACWCVPLPSAAAPLLRAVMTGFDALSVTAGLNAATGAPPALSGALIAFHRAHLPEGFRPAADEIGDDLVLGRALSAHGPVVVSALPVLCERRALPTPAVRAMLRRWIRVALAPAFGRVFGFPTMLASFPTLLLALPFAPLPALLAMALRLAGAWLIRRELTGDRLGLRALAQMALAEGVVLDAALRAAWDQLRGADLVWRDRRYRLGPGGRILELR